MSQNIRLSDFIFDPIKDLLGKGNYGHVYKVKYKDDKYYALKKIVENPDDSNQKKNIMRELNIMSNIDHPNIEKFYGGFTDNFPSEKNNCYFFCLEFIDGKNLNDMILRCKAKNEHINQGLIVLILKGILEGLDYLHKKNIYHRDITPDNIMIENNTYNIKITDFGISAYYQDNFNQFKTIVGRRAFVCPEIYYAHNQNQPYAIYNSKCDIFSLGVLMFRLMTFSYPKILQYRNIQDNDYKMCIDSNIYNKKLIDIVMSMLEEEPNNRPTCEQLKNSLKSIEMEIGTNIKPINYKPMLNSKKSAFSCVMNCFSNIEQIYKYLIENKKNKNNKKLEQSFFSVIKSFGETLEKAKNMNTLNNNFINQFIDTISEKIKIFKEEINIIPKLIIKTLLDYFLMNLPNIFIYNNIKGCDLFDERNQEDNECFLINQAFEKYKVLYKNIFVNTFYFLVLKRYICPECNSIIKQDMDIECDIEFFSKGSNKDLIKNYESKKEISNYGKNSMMCNQCGVMSSFIYEFKNIYIAPEVFIIYFNYNEQIDEFLEIKECYKNKDSKSYNLKAIILSNQTDNNDINYEVAIKRDSSWTYYTNNGTSVLHLKDILAKGNICTAFYCLSNNEFSVFNSE